MSSRAKFSLGWPTLLVLESSQMSMAGSLATDWLRRSKLPAPCVRNSWFWPYMNSGRLTFSTDVAKCPCHSSVSFSLNGLVDATRRDIHHCCSWRSSSCRRCCTARRAARSRVAPAASEANVGAGIESAPASVPASATRRSTVAS